MKRIKEPTQPKPTDETVKASQKQSPTASGKALMEFVNKQMKSKPEDWEALERALKEDRERQE